MKIGPIIQKLETIKDLELLVEGNIIKVKFTGFDDGEFAYEGPAVFTEYWRDAYTFLTRAEKKIIGYIFDSKKDLLVKDNKLIQNGKLLGIWEACKGTEDYRDFNKKMKEAGQ